ncbi:MAG: hypothetical protein MSD68_04700 [Blautia sp.]|uniref:hypothetical protein n=1 Tax=Blautia sp. TaxID=1955243 RepID=UPI0025BA3643|nr:hypothetical protein [Blautia sp.]MCI7449010.1 hypothetical protein [Blautia sp.]
MNTFEPFYSDFPEISGEDDGLYRLTPQTDDATQTNCYIEVDDKEFRWAVACSKNKTVTIVIVGEIISVIRGDITVKEAISNVIVAERGTVMKYKACSGAKESDPLVTYYVEKLL